MAYHPLQPEYVFQNEYGKLVVEAVTGVMPVREVHGDQLPDEIKFTVKTAAMVALITENHHAQIAFAPQPPNAACRGYLVLHTAPAAVVVVRIKSLAYAGLVDPHQEIERCHRAMPPVLI